MRHVDVNWRRVVASGVLWAVVYNVVWGGAWFAFMHREWAGAAAAIGQPLPWTAEVWLVWVTFTVPLGVAIMSYAASREVIPRNAVLASMAVWLPLAVGMTAWGVRESFTTRVLALDSLVSLVAMIAASLAGARSLGSARHLQGSAAQESGSNRPTDTMRDAKSGGTPAGARHRDSTGTT